MLSDPHDPNLTTDQPFWDIAEFGPLPPGEVIDLNSTDSTGARLAIPNIIFFVIASIIVIVRFHSRVYFQKVRLSWDDYLCLIAWVFTLVITIAHAKMVAYGWGKHFWDMNALEMSYMAFWVWLAGFYFLSIFFSKCSILALYLRIFHQYQRWFCWSVYAILFLNTAGCMIGFWGSLGLPRPTSAWHPTTMKPVDVSDRTYFQRTASGVNIGVDILIILIPIPIVLKLHLPRAQRIAVIGVFMAAIIATVFSGLRLWSIVFTDSESMAKMMREVPTQGVYIFAVVESNLYLVCACLPVIKSITVQALSKAISARYIQASVYTSKLWLSGRKSKSESSGGSSSMPPPSSAPLPASHEFHYHGQDSKTSDRTLMDNARSVGGHGSEKDAEYDMV